MQPLEQPVRIWHGRVKRPIDAAICALVSFPGGYFIDPFSWRQYEGKEVIATFSVINYDLVFQVRVTGKEYAVDIVGLLVGKRDLGEAKTNLWYIRDLVSALQMTYGEDLRML